ncbi:uncharacterized protein LOC123558300 [Mercenaria mercenaria]|uniref:uncharacterized protein LOC123558300 n=1 Tax=Mercenaria mercenaria TaxID=6596 RepID=UPI00234EAD50|nr:uncharacterized protein LOC123558300 [Mercenaria mercenaria]
MYMCVPSVYVSSSPYLAREPNLKLQFVAHYLSVTAKVEEHAVSPDKIIEDIGGCGRFQMRMANVVHLIKTIVCFTSFGMIVISATPSWWCEDDLITNNLTSCVTFRNDTSIDNCPKKTCTVNGTACRRLNFDKSLTTFVSEFRLVCARDFIPNTINSVQIAGTLVGNVAAEQITDLIGRKPPFFTSILLIMSFNIFGYFSTGWEIALPESFRWYIAHDNPKKAEKIIKSIAKYNKHEEFDIEKALQKPEAHSKDQKYTVFHLFKLALGIVSFGISFGIQSLSGSIYLNVFLFALTGIPSKAIALWLQNRYGRRAAAIFCFVSVAICGLVAGIVQTFEILDLVLSASQDELELYSDHKPEINEIREIHEIPDHNLSPLLCRFLVTVRKQDGEDYEPSVLRGIISSFDRQLRRKCYGQTISLGPEFAKNSYVLELLYYVCGAISVICAVGLLLLPETMNKNLNDKMKKEVEIKFPEDLIEARYTRAGEYKQTTMENEMKVYTIDVTSIPENKSSVENVTSSTKL